LTALVFFAGYHRQKNWRIADWMIADCGLRIDEFIEQGKDKN